VYVLSYHGPADLFVTPSKMTEFAAY
jgi:hypothetical protein